jgi:hypothetical protein
MRHPCPRCGSSCSGSPRAICHLCRRAATNAFKRGASSTGPRTEAGIEHALPEWKLRLLQRRVELGLPLFTRLFVSRQIGGNRWRPGIGGEITP